MKLKRSYKNQPSAEKKMRTFYCFLQTPPNPNPTPPSPWTINSSGSLADDPTHFRSHGPTPKRGWRAGTRRESTCVPPTGQTPNSMSARIFSTVSNGITKRRASLSRWRPDSSAGGDGLTAAGAACRRRCTSAGLLGTRRKDGNVGGRL